MDYTKIRTRSPGSNATGAKRGQEVKVISKTNWGIRIVHNIEKIYELPEIDKK